MSDEKAGDAPVKIGFTFKKPSSAPQPTIKVQVTEKERVDLVTSIAGNRIESVEATPENGPLVIPLPKARNDTGERYKHLVRPRHGKDIPALEPSDESPAKRTKTDADVDAEGGRAADAPLQAAAAPALDLTAFEGENREAVEALLRQARGEDGGEVDDDTFEVPLLLQNRDPRIDNFKDETDQFRADVASRPDEASLEAYERIPIDSFGAAMLRGMDWAPGKPVGLTNKAVVTPTEFVKRAGFRTGLGAQAKPDVPKKKRRAKPGEPLGPQEAMVLPLGPDGRVRHVRSIDEKLVPLSKRGIHEGSMVSIVGGRHEGLVGRVVRTDDAQDMFTVRLEASDENVVVAKSDLSMLTQRPAVNGGAGSESDDSEDDSDDDADDAVTEVPPSKIKQEPARATPSKSSQSSRPSSAASERRRDSRESDEPSNGGDRSKHSTKKESSRDSSGGSSSSKKDSSSSGKKDSSSSGGKKDDKGWLRPHLVVRIVSKSLDNGRFYLKKGVIVDVIGSQVCSVQVDGSRQLVEAKQRMLETVIPKKANQKVMIVEGPDRGRKGRFMEKTKEKDEERAVVQLAGSLSVKSYSLDFVCEFGGDDGMD
eukprot:TRINITY_DN4479_c0_g1_i1.p1 TRINITY_DN4479_c0_g1~~TRINITY_DN4479_c0_g1_i1.p1  ORF type:complete len:595 (+),score=222.38 TRINITY_DN4479_c0_g1_i1:195-1979(+)